MTAARGADESPFHYKSVQPILSVDDLESVARFYSDALGFQRSWEWGDPVNRIGMQAPGSPGSDGERSGGEGAFEIHLIEDSTIGPSGTSSLYLQVSGIEEVYRRCRDAGVEIYLELGDREWGVKDFRVADPAGNRIGLFEVLSEPRSMP